MQHIAMEMYTFVRVTDIINYAKLFGCRSRGLVSAKGRIQAFAMGS
jgi:hypothetical protein